MKFISIKRLFITAIAALALVNTALAEGPDTKVVTGKVIFPVNRYVIPKGSTFLEEFKNKTLPEMKEQNAKLVKVEIVGAASPEGRREHNKMLSERRNAALLDTISKLIAMPADIKSEIVIEDYANLLLIMKESNDRYYNTVLGLYEKYIDNEIELKRRLRIADRGRLWAHVLKTYYPDLRTAKVKLYFEQPAPEPEPESKQEPQPQPQIVQPEIVSPQETTGSMQIVQPDTLRADSTATAAIDSVLYEKERVHILSLKTNLLHDAFWMPNYGMAPAINIHAEYYPLNGHYTYNAAFMFPYYHRWSHHKFFQIRDYELSVRRYFKPAKDDNAEYLGWYAALYAHFAKYGIGLNKEKGWEGEGGGGGLEVGYVMNISRNKRWRLEFSAGIGYFYTRFDPYIYGNPVTEQEDGNYYYDYTGNAKNFKERNHKSSFIDPTHLGVTLTYDLLYRRIQKKGVSVHRKEAMINE